MLLMFLFICVTFTLGCLFSLQKRLNLVVSSLDSVLYCVILLLLCFFHASTAFLTRNPELQAAFSYGHTMGLYKGIITFSAWFFFLPDNS